MRGDEYRAMANHASGSKQCVEAILASAELEAFEVFADNERAVEQRHHPPAPGMFLSRAGTRVRGATSPSPAKKLPLSLKIRSPDSAADVSYTFVFGTRSSLRTDPQTAHPDTVRHSIASCGRRPSDRPA